SDAGKLRQSSYIDQIARGHVNGLAKTFGLRKKTQKEEPALPERDVNAVSEWAREGWIEATNNGYFDGTRPGAPITREETAIVVNRLRNNFLKLIGDNAADIKALEARLKEIERQDS